MPLHNEQETSQGSIPIKTWRVKWAVRSWPRESFASVNGTCQGIGVALLWSLQPVGFYSLILTGEKDGLNQF